jgi:hypothetical protein
MTVALFGSSTEPVRLAGQSSLVAFDVFVLEGWGDQAALLGWSKDELYRVPSRMARVDLCGAALMIEGRRVIAVTEANIDEQFTPHAAFRSGGTSIATPSGCDLPEALIEKIVRDYGDGILMLENLVGVPMSITGHMIAEAIARRQARQAEHKRLRL